MTAIKLIVGLGNPGSEHQGTRHNAGADFVETLARKGGIFLQEESKFFGLTGRINLAGHDLRLLVPTTFMNLSGKSVAAMAGFRYAYAEASPALTWLRNNAVGWINGAGTVKQQFIPEALGLGPLASAW